MVFQKLKHSMRESSLKRNLRTVPSDPGTTPNGKRQKVVGQEIDDSSVRDSMERPSRSRALKKGPARDNAQSVTRAQQTASTNGTRIAGSSTAQRAASVDRKAPPVHSKTSRAPSTDRAEFAR